MQMGMRPLPTAVVAGLTPWHLIKTVHKCSGTPTGASVVIVLHMTVVVREVPTARVTSTLLTQVLPLQELLHIDAVDPELPTDCRDPCDLLPAPTSG
jgi:hypothetical protein